MCFLTNLNNIKRMYKIEACHNGLKIFLEGRMWPVGLSLAMSGFRTCEKLILI